MNRLALLALALPPLLARAGTVTLENISPHLATNAQIVWKASTIDLPKELWTYQKRRQVFSNVTISNALLLGEFTLKPFPKAFTKPITLWDATAEGDPQPDYFAVDPDSGSITFRRQRRLVGEGDSTPNAIIERTWRYATQLGMEKAQLSQATIADNSTVSLPRRLDGIPFREDMEGFSVQYGTQGEIRSLNLVWPRLERATQERVIGSNILTLCIRAFKTPVLPHSDEPDYFRRVKTLSNAQALTITNIVVYYSEGRFGRQPDETKPETFVGPIAVLDAVADFGTSSIAVKLLAPLLASDADRLLAGKKLPSSEHP
jgi:hypothetical protein